MPALLAGAGVIALACLIGAAVPLYVGILGESATRLIALPAAVVLGLLLLASPKLLFILIILIRASGDVLFNETKVTIAGYAIGVGGMINGFVLLVALLLAIEKPRLLPRKVVLGIWMPFLLVACYGVLASPVKIDALKLFLSQLSYFAIFVIAFYFVRSERDFRWCVWIVLASSVLPALYALVDIALNAPGAGWSNFRLRSTFHHPNQFAFFLTVMLLMVLYMLKSTSSVLSPFQRAGLTAYMFFLLGLLLLTQTRSAWIACFAVFTVYAIFYQRRYLVYVAIAPVLALLIPSVQERVFDLGAGNEYVAYATLNSFAWRRLIWETGLNWMQPSHYLLGYGLDSFKYYSPVFFPLAGHMNFGAHSVFVQWMFELGALGVATYLWVFARMARILTPFRRLDPMGFFITASIIGAYMTVSLADNLAAYLAFNWYVWFILGAGCAVMLSRSKEQPPAEVSRSPAPGGSS